MFSIKPCSQPSNSLLANYQKNGAYTDCYQTEISAEITQSQFIQAFYSTAIFKLERLLLKYLVSKPSSDNQLNLLCEGKTETFSAWTVEEKCQDQLLMCDYLKRTRSWLMVEAINTVEGQKTRLYFGSAVVPRKHSHTGETSPKSGLLTGLSPRILLGFHKLYSRVLLYCARSRLIKAETSGINR